jgi:uncharacterized cupredoxin-like copper-binding protein
MLDRRAPAFIAVVAIAVAGCGDAKSSTPSSAASTKSAEPAAEGSASSSRAVTDGRTTVSMADYQFKPSALSVRGGTLRVTANNDGGESHEFVVIRTTKAPNGLPMKGDQASEAGAIGEIPEQKPGRRVSHTFTLKPGKYVYICNVPGHYKAGMYGTVVVR